MSEPLYRAVVEGFKGIFAVLGMKLDIVGEENIPLQGGAVLALNHTSYLDFALGGVPADRRGRTQVRASRTDRDGIVFGVNDRSASRQQAAEGPARP